MKYMKGFGILFLSLLVFVACASDSQDNQQVGGEVLDEDNSEENLSNETEDAEIVVSEEDEELASDELQVKVILSSEEDLCNDPEYIFDHPELALGLTKEEYENAGFFKEPDNAVVSTLDYYEYLLFLLEAPDEFDQDGLRVEFNKLDWEYQNSMTEIVVNGAELFEVYEDLSFEEDCNGQTAIVLEIPLYASGEPYSSLGRYRADLFLDSELVETVTYGFFQ